MSVIIHADLDTFFVSVERLFNPELCGKPVVVGGKPGGRGVIASASYEARAFGLHAGMPLVTAYCLCPQAIFVEGNFPRYHEASQKFMAILASFSPFLEPAGLDEAYLDVTGFESLYGSIYQMAATIKHRVREEVGLCASIGIASSKVVAKVASALSKPDGLIEITSGEERSFLAPLPVNKLPGIGRKAEKILKSLGIKTIGELASAPLALLKNHFGIWGELLNRWANGIDDRKVELPGVAKSISRETTFAKDTKDPALLKATLRYFSERIVAELRQQERRARCVTLKLRYADFTTISRSRTLNQSTSSAQVIFETDVELMERALYTEKQLIRLIGIGVSDLVESGEQLCLLDKSTQRLEQLERTIDRIRRKYGFTAIQTGQTLPLKDLLAAKVNGW